MDPLSLVTPVLALAQFVKTSIDAQALNNATACGLLRRLLCFEEPVREIEAELRCATRRDLSSGKLNALSRLHGYAAEVKDVTGQLLRNRGGFVSRVKSLFNAIQWKEQLDQLARNIDSCVADLTMSEVREQGLAAMKAVDAAAEFHTMMLAQQEGLARQVALLQRAGAAGIGRRALEAVVRELADELRMERSDVKKQLEEERFLLHQDMAQLSDLEARVLEAIDAKALSESDVARLGAVIGEKLAALDSLNGANADAVAAAVASSLERAGLSAAGVQAVVREEVLVRLRSSPLATRSSL